MRLVVGVVSACHQNVVKVDEHEIKVLEDRIHKPLERLCCVFEAKRHAEELEKTKRRDNRCLGNVLGPDWDLMVTSYEIHFTEHGLTRKVGREIVDPRNRVSVVFGRAIEASEISTRSPAPPGLGAICSGEE